MSRHFTGSAHDRVDFSPGAIASLDGGPMSAAVLWRPTTNHDGSLFQASNGSGFEVWGFSAVTDGHTWHSISGSFRAVNDWSAADGWRIDGFSKPNGAGQVVRGHSAILGGAWTHVDSSTASDAGAGPGTGYIRVGDNNTLSMALNADVAAVVLCAGVWSDATFEALASGLAAWDTAVGSDAAALWAFNQASTGSAVTDLTGGGADQTAISGTSVGEDPPGWSYDLIEPAVVSAAVTLPHPVAVSPVVSFAPNTLGGAVTLPGPPGVSAAAVSGLAYVSVAVTLPSAVVAAPVVVTNPTKYPTDTAVALAWLRTAAGLTPGMVDLELPRDISDWADAGFVTLGSGDGQPAILGGEIQPNCQRRSATVAVSCWAVNPDSERPPRGKSNDLAERVVAAAYDEQTLRRTLALPGGYWPVRVLETSVDGLPTPTPTDPGAYARTTLSLRIHWVLA